MTNSFSSTKKGVCRRSLLKSVPMMAGAIIVTGATAQNLFAQQKLAHDAAGPSQQRAAMLGLHPVRRAGLMQGG